MKGLATAVLVGLAMMAQAQQLVPTRGKSFWMGFMENYQQQANLYLYISSDVNTSGTVSVPLQGWAQNFTVAANTVTQVEVPISAMSLGSESVGNKGVFVGTEDTVAVYALNYQQATADAAVIYPTKSLGTEYRVQAFYGLVGFDGLNSEMLIVATEDGTEVEITPACNTLGGQIAGVPFTVQLDAGETYQIHGVNSSVDLTGSTVRGTQESGGCRPFAVFSGSVCPDIPDGCFACDHVFDQNLPSGFWGTSYFSVPWQNTTAYLYRVLANEDDTHITVDGAPPFTLNAGQFNEVVGTNTPHCISGDKPFSVSQFMEGNSCAGNSDPALLILNAEEQKINDITFATVVSPNITAQYINLVVDGTDIGDVVLDGVPVSTALFFAFPACSDHSYAQIPLTQGSHRVSCPGGVTGYVYGTGPNFETYAYSVGSFTPLPPLNYDTVFCGLDSTDVVTLSPIEPVFNPVWTTQSNPNDTLFEGPSYTFQPDHTDVYVVTGTENISGCTQQYFFSVELGDPPATNIVAPASVCAYTPVVLDLVLTPPGTYNYQWTPDAGLNDPNVQDPIATVSGDTWYHVNVTSISGCSATQDSVLVTVTPGDVVSVQATTDPNQICSGGSTQLDVEVRQIIANDNFNGTLGSMWQDVQGGLLDNVCGSVSGNALYFDLAGDRYARTVPLNVANGGEVRFALKIASGLPPCEDVDPGEGIILEYSINGGISWSLMASYSDNQYPDFGDVIVQVPGPAETTATLFRWKQLSNSGLGQDNWILDNVAVAATDATDITFNWTPAATLSSGTIANPVATPPSTTLYTVSLTDDVTGCPYTGTVQVLVGQNFALNMTSDTVLCGAGQLVLDADPVESGGYTWSWTPNDGSLSSNATQSPSATVFSTTQYLVTVTNQFGCSVNDSVLVTIAAPVTLSTFATPNPICQGETSQLQVQAFGGSGNYSYAWSPAVDLSSATIANPVADPMQTTFYTVTVIDALCGALVQDNIELSVLPAPQVDLGADRTICQGTSTTLNAGPANSWLWSTNANTQTIVVDEGGEYWVHASNGTCDGADTVNVLIAPDPGPLGYSTTGCDGRAATITVPYNGGTYHWFNDSTTQSVQVQGTGEYSFTLIDSYGCVYTDTVKVFLDPLGYGVVVPNVFTPNADGDNDWFEPQANGSDDVDVTIFNRWGQEMFHASRMNKLWDGTNMGDKLPEGTYYYVVKFSPTCENEEQVLKGHVTLLR